MLENQLLWFHDLTNIKQDNIKCELKKVVIRVRDDCQYAIRLQ